MSGFHDNVLLGASGSQGYQISRSVRLRSSASAYFNRTLTTPTDGKKWTYSVWVKRGILTAGTGTAQQLLSAGSATAFFRFSTTDTLVSGWTGAANLETTQVFRDPSAWYHIMLVVDTTQATASNRVKYYVNGTQITAFATTDYPTQNSTTTINSAVAHNIGAYTSSTQYLDGYLTEVNFIDGQALTPSSFGETNTVTGVWQPKKYAGTYGTNGFFLNFSDNSAATAAAIGKDYSGNGNNWTPNNISVTAGATYDSMIDVPTQWADGGNGRGNYAVMNPLDKNASGTMAEGNLKWTAGAAQVCTRGTFAIPASGKFYMECLVGTASSATVGISFGLAASTVALDTSSGATNLYQLYASTNRQINLNNSTTGSLSGGFSANDILQIAVDVDNQKMWLGVNNTWYNSAFTGNGDPVAGTNATSTASMVGFFPFSNCYQNSAYWNFGQRPFAYTPPSGFKALNTLNLPTPTILKGNQYFDATLYTGTSASNAVVNASGFQPDLVWLKNRNYATGTNHVLVDSVRGVSLGLASNLTNAEFSTAGNFSSINSNGFTVAGTTRDYNFLNDTFVAWQWKEGATQGFDIVTYTGDGVDGRTVAHNLGVVPSMVIVKSRSTGTDWNVKHASLSSNNVLQLNATNAQNTPGSGYIGDLNSSTTFTLKNGGAAITNVNGNGTTYVAYLFAEVAGFSKFGNYTGNGSADGPFVFCGFRPRFVMIKRTNAVANWYMYDTSRDTYNLTSKELYPNLSNAETTNTIGFDILSNGFKARSSDAAWNASGGTYIFMAFAENPFKNSLAR